MITRLDEWFSLLRDVSLAGDAPVKLKEGKWEVAPRKDVWQEIAPRVFDEHLDRFRELAVEVLKERNPELDLDPEQRFAASVHGKVLKYSTSLRKGLAETLALVATTNDLLTSCSHGKGEVTAILSVREILKDADWGLCESAHGS